MKVFTIGDIHGRVEALKEVLASSRFDYEVDTLILLGDVCDGGYNTYEVVEELLKIKHIIFVIGNHDCLDIKTECLTKRGWLKYDELNLADEIYSFNLSTEKGEWSQINKIIIKDYFGKMVKLKSKHADMLITPNHRVFFKLLKQHKNRPTLWDSNYGYELAINLHGGYEIISSASEGLDEYPISDDMLKIVGWILTDGHASYDRKHSFVYFTITQSKINNLQHIRDLISRLGLKFTEDIRMRQIKSIKGVILNGNPLPEHTFRLTAESSRQIPLKEKLFPEWAYKLSDRQTNIFFKEIVRGDGTGHPSRNGAAIYGKKEFLENVQRMCIIKGYRSCIRQNTRGDYVLTTTYKNTWQFNTSDKQKNKQFGLTNYTGKVWCLNVPHSNFMVRRNGKHYFTGNCMFMNHISSGWLGRIWTQQGGKNTLASYKKHIPLERAHQEFFNTAVPYYIQDNMLFVHGGFDARHGKTVEDANIELLTWDRDLIVYAREGNRIPGWDWIFVGHTTTEMYSWDLEPIRFQNLYMIDCGAGWTGKLCIMDIHTKEYWLSKQQNPAI